MAEMGHPVGLCYSIWVAGVECPKRWHYMFGWDLRGQLAKKPQLIDFHSCNRQKPQLVSVAGNR